MKTGAVFLLVVLTLVGVLFGKNPIEIGSVQWGTDLGAAKKQSAHTGRPVFLLFQEVPGCAGCQMFGRNVLSEPLLVEWPVELQATSAARLPPKPPLNGQSRKSTNQATRSPEQPAQRKTAS